jgi:hypothetical protein
MCVRCPFERKCNVKVFMKIYEKNVSVITFGQKIIRNLSFFIKETK